MSKKYTTIQDDTWDLISQKAYGSDKFTHVLTNANRNFSDIIFFDAGAILEIPDLASETKSVNVPAWRE